jgi:tetratricopeptide (TPR) repeat protein
MLTNARPRIFDTPLTRFVLVVWPLLIIASNVEASGKIKTWVEWQVEANALMDAGNYEAATQAFRNALGTAVQAHESPQHLAIVYNSLGSAYTQRGQYLEAEDNFRCALDIEKNLLGPASLEYALVFASIALLPTQGADREQAIEVLRTAIACHEGKLASSEVAIAKDYLIKLLYSGARFADAEEILYDGHNSWANGNAKPDPYIRAELLNDEGVFEDHMGHQEQALKLDQEAIDTLEAALGTEHPALVVPLNNLATFYAKLDRYDDAERMFLRADAVCIKTLGENHPVRAALLANYAVVLRKMGRKKESKKINAEAQEIAQSSNRRNGVGSTISLAALRASSN